MSDRQRSDGQAVPPAGTQARGFAFLCRAAAWLERIAAMRARRNEIVVTAGAKWVAWLNRLAPRLVDWLMVRYGRPR